MKLHTVVGKRMDGPAFGIEAEVEGMHGMKAKLDDNGDFRLGKYWRVISDGSLRDGGVEIVAAQPIAAAHLAAALDQLEAELCNSPSNPFDDDCETYDTPSTSVRTSTHVHINVLDMDFINVFALLVLGAAWEPIMQRYIAPSRRQNLFCLPMFQCATFANCLRAAYSRYVQGTENLAFDHLVQVGKYSSINTGRLLDLGTIEFRALHGWPGEHVVREWCLMLDRLRTISMGVRGVEDLLALLLRLEDEVVEMLAPNLPLQGGEAYTSFKEAVSMAFSLVSRAKDMATSNDPVYQYKMYGVTAASWSSATYESFNSYTMPPLDILYDALDRWEEGRSAFGIAKVDATSIEFVVTPKSDPLAVTFTIKVSRPTPLVSLPEETVTFSAEVH